MPAPDSFDRITVSGWRSGTGTGWPRRRPIVLSRALYRTRVLDLSGLRPRDWQGAVSLQLEAWAPFDQPEFLVGLIGHRAVAFAWDSARVSATLEAASQLAERPVLPEDLLRAPMPQGVRVHACLDGFEAQAWQDGAPAESLWWPSFPDEAQWRGFLRGRVASAAGSPAALHDAGTPWRARPWLRVMPVQALGRHGNAWERLLWAALAAGLAMAAGWRTQEWQQAHLAREAARAEGERLQAESATGLPQREQVLRNQVRVEKLGQALDGVAVFELMSGLGQALPPKAVLLRELKVEGSSVRLSLAMGADIARSTVVQSLQATGAFSDVREQREPGPGGSVTFEMSYRRLPGPASGVALSSSSPTKGSP